MSDYNDIQLLKQGDSRYLTSLYKDVLPTVIGWIVRNNGSEEDAYDIFQDTLEALIHKTYAIGADESLNIRGLAVQIAKNKWIDKLRRKRYDEKVRSEELKRYDDEYSAEPVIETVEREAQQQRLLKATFAKLSSTCQQLLSMVIAERSTADIVDELDMTNANTMYRRKHACMKTWKTYIEEAGYSSYGD